MHSSHMYSREELKGSFSVPHIDNPVSTEEKALKNLEMQDGEIKITPAKIERVNYSSNDHMEPISTQTLKTIIVEEMNKIKDKDFSDRRISLRLCTDIKNQLKCIPQDRYRYVVHVTGGDLRNQGGRVASRCLWDMGTDRCFTMQLTNTDNFIVVNAYALYTM